MLLEEINFRISVECNFIQMYSWFYKIKMRENVKSYTIFCRQVDKIFFLTSLPLSFSLSFSLFHKRKISFIFIFHLLRDWCPCFRMRSKSLITKKVTNECRRDLIRYLFKIQRESGETSEEKKREIKIREIIPMIRLPARRKIQIWLFRIGDLFACAYLLIKHS